MVETDLSEVTGKSFTEVTVTVTVDVLEEFSSLTVNSKVSEPLKLRFGVYTAVSPERVTVPFVAVPTA